MEEDRLQTDLGLAADIEESQLTQAGASFDATPTADEDSPPAVKQPKKRFVGRRTAAAAEAAKGDAATAPDSETGALQSQFPVHTLDASHTHHIIRVQA
jgi:2-(3-amino-3-carboxypropyl)histidine synthase